MDLSENFKVFSLQKRYSNRGGMAIYLKRMSKMRSRLVCFLFVSYAKAHLVNSHYASHLH